jgi:hypothetical protein
MGSGERKLYAVRREAQENKFTKESYYIEEQHEKMLSELSVLTGKDASFLVNEAIGDLVDKYQPKTDIDLLGLKLIQ